MASLQEYCEQLPTGTLEDIVFGDMNTYPRAVMLVLCRELLARDPDRWDVRKTLWYLTDED